MVDIVIGLREEGSMIVGGMKVGGVVLMSTGGMMNIAGDMGTGGVGGMMILGDTDRHLRMVLLSDHASNFSLVPNLPLAQRVLMGGAAVPYLEVLVQWTLPLRSRRLRSD